MKFKNFPKDTYNSELKYKEVRIYVFFISACFLTS